MASINSTIGNLSLTFYSSFPKISKATGPTITLVAVNGFVAHSKMSTLRTNTVSAVYAPTSEKVKIPDIFELFMSRHPTINPSYEFVREQALEWANKQVPLIQNNVSYTADRSGCVAITKRKHSACAGETLPFLLLSLSLMPKPISLERSQIG